MDKQQIMDRIEKDGVKFVNLQFTDLLGVVKSITIGVRHLEPSLADGTWFDGSSIKGFTGINESDMFLKPDTSTYAVVPWLDEKNGKTARFICDVHTPDGQPFEGDPRHILKKVMKEAKDMGFTYNTGPELEFFIFKKDNGSVEPLPHDRAGYFDLTTDLAQDVRLEMVVALEKFGINVEAAHHEVATGQHEIDFKYGDALKTADNATTLKFVLKAIAQRHGLHATFMPKPIAGINGSGMHVHQSLFRGDETAFYDGNDEHKLSKVAKQFIAGQLKHMRAISAITSPTVNSYKRLVPGYEAPVYLSWGSRNRSALIRIPRIHKDHPKSARIELRCPDPTANPYLAFAVMLKAGLEGIKNEMEVQSATTENLYEYDEAKRVEKGIVSLPQSLGEAIQELKKDELIKNALGEHTFRNYIEAKTREWDSYRLSVSQWEIGRYIEMY